MNLIFLEDENIGCNYRASGTTCILIIFSFFSLVVIADDVEKTTSTIEFEKKRVKCVW